MTGKYERCNYLRCGQRSRCSVKYKFSDSFSRTLYGLLNFTSSIFYGAREYFTRSLLLLHYLGQDFVLTVSHALLRTGIRWWLEIISFGWDECRRILKSTIALQLVYLVEELRFIAHFRITSIPPGSEDLLNILGVLPFISIKCFMTWFELPDSISASFFWCRWNPRRNQQKRWQTQLI